MSITRRGFLYQKNGKIRVDHEKTNSILLNNLHIDLLLKHNQYMKGILLDAGCGEKPYSLIYEKITEKSIGVDVEYGIHDQKAVDVFASLDQLPFPDCMFDTVLCTNVLEHIAENGKSFSELSRVLKDNGYMILSVPFLYPAHEIPHDYYRYSFYGLKYQMEKNGLTIKKMIPLGGVGMMIIVYCNLFLCKFLKMKMLNFIACILQEGVYKIYRGVCLDHLISKEDKGMMKIISTGYFIVAQKCRNKIQDQG